jgi:hypothetical protein
MPRRYEIEVAFRESIQIEANGRRTVTTSRFVENLQRYNWNWSLREANRWIEHTVTTFKDVSAQEGEDRTFMVYNPNGGL